LLKPCRFTTPDSHRASGFKFFGFKGDGEGNARFASTPVATGEETCSAEFGDGGDASGGEGKGDRLQYCGFAAAVVAEDEETIAGFAEEVVLEGQFEIVKLFEVLDVDRFDFHELNLGRGWM
jgi:hypothetical protein